MKKFQGLVKEAEAAQPGAGLEEACEQLQALIAELKLPKAALQQSGECETRSAKLQINTSAHCSA